VLNPVLNLEVTHFKLKTHFELTVSFLDRDS